MGRTIQGGSFPRWLLAVLVTALFGVLAGGLWLYIAQERHMVKGAEDKLRAIAGLKARQIAEWRRERLADAAQIMEIPYFRKEAAQWIAASGRKGSDLPVTMRILRSYRKFSEVQLVDTAGIVHYSLTDHHWPLHPEAVKNLAVALREKRPVFVDLHEGATDYPPHTAVIAPLFDKGARDAKPVGAIILHADAREFLYPLVQEWPEPSGTAETLLLRRDGDSVVYLNELRHRQGAVLNLRVPLSRAGVLSAMAAGERGGVTRGKDYRGADVLAAFRRIPDSPWTVVAKVDAEEALAAWRARSVLTMALILSIMAVASFCVAVVWHRNREAQYRALYEAGLSRRRSEERHRATLMSVGDGVIVADASGRVELLNPVAEALTGWRQEEARGKVLEEVFRIVDEESRRETGNPARRVLREDKSAAMTEHPVLIARDGSERPIAESGAPIRGEQGEVVGVVLVFRDQTRERRIRKELESSEAMLRESQRVASVGHYAFRADYRTWTGSETLDDIFGIGPGYRRTVDGWLDIVHPECREEMSAYLAGHVLRDGNPFDKEYRIVRIADGAVRWVHVRGKLDTDAAGRVTGMFGTVQDVTSRKLAEEERTRLQSQLLRSQKLESIGRLAGGVAHDFNNMLGVIIGHADLALMQADPAQPLHRDLREILTAANRSAELTRQLLAFARRQTISPKVVDLNESVRGMLTMLERLLGEDKALRWKAGEGLGKAYLDPSQVDQVLVNLTINARDAIAGAGTIAIETGNAEFGDAYCAVHPGFVPGKYVMLAVTDTGRGMEREILEHIFEPFFSTKELGKGTGLGLATVYGIVQQNKGFIDIESVPGKGTSIRIYLPRIEDEPVGEEAERQVPEILYGTETIMLVEDDEAILDLGRIILEGLGYTVLAVRLPTKAVSLAESYPGPIHLLVTDVVMPEMNGRQLAERLAPVKPGMKRLFMSGYTADVIAHQGVLDRGLRFLQKPFSVEALGRKVREALEGEGGGGPAC